MRVFKTRAFHRFADGERISDEALCEAIARAERGLVDADLGGGVIKQRVARPGQGRSGGYRTLIACRWGDRAVFIYGFAKNDLENIGAGDLSDLRNAARVYLALTSDELEEAVEEKRLIEVDCDGEEVP